MDGAACGGGRTMVAHTTFERYCGWTQRFLISFLISVLLSPLALKIKHTHVIAKRARTTTQSNHMTSFRASSHVTKTEQFMRSLM